MDLPPKKPPAAPTVTTPTKRADTAAPMEAPAEAKKPVPRKSATGLISLVLAGLAFLAIGLWAPPSFVTHFTVFVLACFVGYMVIWNVTPALHTPLMSVTNAISSIIAIGALVQVAPPIPDTPDRPVAWIVGLAVVSIALAAINMFGGFAVTQRMLDMFRK